MKTAVFLAMILALCGFAFLFAGYPELTMLLVSTAAVLIGFVLGWNEADKQYRDIAGYELKSVRRTR